MNELTTNGVLSMICTEIAEVKKEGLSKKFSLMVTMHKGRINTFADKVKREFFLNGLEEVDQTQHTESAEVILKKLDRLLCCYPVR